MKNTKTGWVIYTPAFRFTGPPRIIDFTFSLLRKDAIAKVGTKKQWREYREKFNYHCVRADQTLTIDN